MQSLPSVIPLVRGGFQQIEPYVWYDTPWLMGSHEPAEVLLGRPEDLMDPTLFNQEIYGLELVTQQRLRPIINITPGLVDAHCRIDCENHLTEVRKTGMQVFSIGEFPDRVGERIAA